MSYQFWDIGCWADRETESRRDISRCCYHLRTRCRTLRGVPSYSGLCIRCDRERTSWWLSLFWRIRSGFCWKRKKIRERIQACRVPHSIWDRRRTCACKWPVMDSEVGESESGHMHRRPIFFEVLNQGLIGVEGNRTKPKVILRLRCLRQTQNIMYCLFFFRFCIYWDRKRTR